MIIIEPRVRQLMIEDAVSTFPDACCGFMFGREETDGTRIILDVLIVDNSKEGDKRRRFAISPQDYMTAEQHALDHDWTLLGVYHSHPNHPARPSAYDREWASPWYTYIIVSVMDGRPADLTAWQLDDDRKAFSAETWEILQPNEVDS